MTADTSTAAITNLASSYTMLCQVPLITFYPLQFLIIKMGRLPTMWVAVDIQLDDPIKACTSV